MNVIIAVLGVATILLLAELWWRQQTVHSEFSRKFVHITVGSFVALWPFFLSWRQIQLLSLAFLIVVLASKRFRLFESIHSVQRSTWGEVLFAAAVGILAVVTDDKWIYTAALLQMSLADGLAAIVGVRFGGKHNYRIFGYKKSVIGTAAFFVASFLILLGYRLANGAPDLNLALAAGIAAVASAGENLGVRGLDNLVVPLVVGLLLMYH